MTKTTKIAFATALIIAGTTFSPHAYAKGKSLVIGGVHTVPSARSTGNFSLPPNGYRSSFKVEQNLGRTRSYYQPSYGFK